MNKCKFKVGQKIRCMCQLGCGIEGVISKITGQLVYFEDDGVEAINTINSSFILDEEWEKLILTPLYKVLDESED